STPPEENSAPALTVPKSMWALVHATARLRGPAEEYWMLALYPFPVRCSRLLDGARRATFIGKLKEREYATAQSSDNRGRNGVRRTHRRPRDSSDSAGEGAKQYGTRPSPSDAHREHSNN